MLFKANDKFHNSIVQVIFLLKVSSTLPELETGFIQVLVCSHSEHGIILVYKANGHTCQARQIKQKFSD